MSTTKISWTDLTLNPVIGCTHAAYQAGGRKMAHPGCLNCYAETMCSRVLPGFEVHNRCSSGGKWTGKIEVLHERLSWPFTRKEYKQRRDDKPRRCFLTSLSDMGHPALSETDWMAINGMMVLAPWIIWQDLTKRPERQAALLKRYSPAKCVEAFRSRLTDEQADECLNSRAASLWNQQPLRHWEDFRHIQRYVSISDQPTADALIPLLLQMPAAVRGVSLEPMIGPVDLSRWLRPHQSLNPDGYGGGIPVGWTTDFRRVNHVIIGGESGRGARPFALEWAEDVVEQCQSAKVPCFVKQLGSQPVVHATNPDRGLFPPHPMTLTDWARCHIRIFGGRVEGDDTVLWPKPTGKGEDMREWPASLRVRQHVGDKS